MDIYHNWRGWPDERGEATSTTHDADGLTPAVREYTQWVNALLLAPPPAPPGNVAPVRVAVWFWRRRRRRTQLSSDGRAVSVRRL